jgi:signal transduction histidine kinase
MNKKRIQPQDRSLISTYFDKIKHSHSKPLRQIPRWRHPLLGYLFSIPLVGLSTGILSLELRFLPTLSSRSPMLSLAIVLVALIWGIGPAIFAVLLSTLALEYFLLPPSNQFNLNTLNSLLQILPFMLAGLLIAIIAGQRESARRRALSAEQEKQERASLLEAVFDSMPDTVIVYDSEGYIVQSNAAGRQSLRKDVSPDHVNISVDKRAARTNMRDENGHPLPKEQWPQVRVARGELLGGADTMDIIVSTLSGRDMQLSVSGSPIRDQEGKIVGAVCIYREVTERRQLERQAHEMAREALARASELEAVFDSITDSIFIYDEHELIHRSNSAARQLLTFTNRPKYSSHSSSERTAILSICDEDGAPLPEKEFPAYRVLRGEILKGTGAADITVRTAEGQHIQTSITGAPIRNADGGFAGAVVVLRDVTERRQLERRTQETLHRMDDFLSIASHELRTPLASVKGNVQLADMKLAKLLPQCSTPEPELTKGLQFIQQLLQRADRQSELLNRLVNDLLDVSRIQAGKLELHLAPCDLVTIVHDIVQEQRQVASSRPIRLQLPSEPISVFVDADRIGQVVTNYLTNALKYSEADTPIDVSLHVEGNNARVSVRDEGPGLSEADQQHIWKRFYQAKGSNVKYGSSVGLGIGLHICQSIITRHQGNVGVQSTPGQGSTFWFTLPISLN